MKIKVKELAWHRNGVGGEGFYAVLFTWFDGEDREAHMLAHVFDGLGQCAVHCLDKKTVKIGVNSWRGDHFEPELRKAIKTQASSGSVRCGPFGISTT
jgi:hypothetical protein